MGILAWVTLTQFLNQLHPQVLGEGGTALPAPGSMDMDRAVCIAGDYPRKGCEVDAWLGEVESLERKAPQSHSVVALTTTVV